MFLNKVIFIISLVFFSGKVFSADIPDDLNSYCFFVNDVTTKAKARNYSEALKVFNLWNNFEYKDKYADDVQVLQSVIESSEQSFNKYILAKAAELKDKSFVIDKKTVKITSLDATNIYYKIKLPVGFKVTHAKVRELPPISIYTILKHTRPSTYQLDTARILLLDHDFTAARNLLARAKSKGVDIKPLERPYSVMQEINQTTQIHQLLMQADNALRKNELSELTLNAEKAKELLSKNKELDPRFAEAFKKYENEIANVKKKQKAKELERFLNFPVQKDQQTDVTCLENPKFKYEIYLPPQYDHSGRILLPIIYFFHPGRKSYIQKYKSLAKEMGLILVTNYQTHGRIDYTRIHDSWYAMMKDIHSRVHFEPSRQISSGHSGGGFFCYDFARQFSHHISGTISMGGWLANRHDERWQWFREGFLVARVSGEKDNGKSYLDRDFRHMDKYNVKLKDWQAPNRSPSPPNVFKEVLTWLFENTQLATDKDDAEAFKERCLSNIGTNKYGQALNEALQVIIDEPYTFKAIAAQQVIEKIFESENVNLKNNYDPEVLAFESPIIIDLVGFYISVGGIIKNHTLFNNAVDSLEKANRLLEWDDLTTWRMLSSPNKKILDYDHAEKIIMKRKEISTLQINHKIFLGLIYKFKGRDIDAQKIYEEAKTEVDSGTSHNKGMFKKLQRLMQ
ncbi:MAG: hypothetical protein NE334_16195 [Lentisphaeraceae bacterium]|nr:hypothetical protein [Lentisphaeraceae bacterium]